MKEYSVCTKSKKMALAGCLPVLVVLAFLAVSPVLGQAPVGAVVVQPGAPGKPSQQLPSSTRGTLPPSSLKDIEFMQGMIMHHAQAVEMTEMIESHTKNKDIALIGERIRKSQVDEMQFMKSWLASRGALVAPRSVGSASNSHGHEMGGQPMLMPGMLSPKQMEELRKASDSEFDQLFLSGMIQHHEGALIMVKNLFDTAGAGQNPEIYNFATDVDSGQRAEIKSMQALLNKRS
jgi:uncharacterized protein (DUF305 family)